MRTALNLAVDAHHMKVAHGEQVLVDEVVLGGHPGRRGGLACQVACRAPERGCQPAEREARSIFLAHCIDGLRYAEIAKIRRVSVTTARTHVAKATLQRTRWMQGWY